MTSCSTTHQRSSSTSASQPQAAAERPTTMTKPGNHSAVVQPMKVANGRPAAAVNMAAQRHPARSRAAPKPTEKAAPAAIAAAPS